jgi:hypothetical protein
VLGICLGPSVTTVFFVCVYSKPSTILNISPFPLRTAQFMGKFFDNWQFVSLILHQYYWRCHRSTSISMSAISDIRHRHLLFRYRRQICRTEKRHSDIGSVPISTSEFIPISDTLKKKKYFTLQIRTCAPWIGKRAL